MNKNINFFDSESIFFPFRWLILIGVAVGILMLYADLNGWRLLQGQGQQQWSASGPGYHK